MDSTTILLPLFIFFIIVWCLIWKGIALWKSARNKQKVWFVCLLIINTLGILEMIYIAFFQKDNDKISKTKEIKNFSTKSKKKKK